MFETALAILEECPEKCDSSCYRCLRSFRNKLDHAQLDRFVGTQLIRHILNGTIAPFDRERAIRSLTVLANELERQLSDAFKIIRNFQGNGPPIVLRRKADGSERAVDIQSPVAPGLPVFGTADPTRLLADDLRIRRHLGEEVERIRSAL